MAGICLMTDRFPKDTAQQRAYRALEALIAGEDAAIDLAQAALLVASIEYPDLAMAHYMAQLDALARRVRDALTLPDPITMPQLPSDLDPLIVIETLNRVLFDEEQFHGNLTDYHNPNNSFLNKVLDDHTGIPITLSLLYIEVGKRVGILFDGIGLPYHFVVRHRLSDGFIYIDPFDSGQFLTEQDCYDIVRRIAKNKPKPHPQWFAPVTHRQFLARILNNLKQNYIEAEAYERALIICDFVLLLAPKSAPELRDRGILHLQLKHYSRALRDLTAYLDLAPKARDRYEIQNHVKNIRQAMAMMN